MILGLVAVSAAAGGLTAWTVSADRGGSVAYIEREVERTPALGTQFTSYQAEQYPDLTYAAENAVKQEMIIDEIIAREGIEADDAAREKVAFMYDETVDSLTAVIGENMMDKMAAMQNALEFLCENAEVTVTKMTAAADTAAAEAALDETAADDAAGTETDTAAEAEAE